MKAAFYIFAVSFVISTVFVAPFVKHDNVASISKTVSDLSGVTNTLQKKIDADEIVIRLATQRTNPIPFNVTVTNISLTQVSDTNFDEIKKRLNDDEAILHGEKISEKFVTSDTNRTTVYLPPKEGPFVIFKLKHAAIKSSVDIIAQGPAGESPMLSSFIINNVVIIVFSNTNQFNEGVVFYVNYLPDDNNTNLIKAVWTWNGGVLFDNVWEVFTNKNE